MFPVESFRRTLLKIVDILGPLEIPFHLTGGVTGVVYGEPRLTQDIDIVLQNEATRNQLQPLLSALAESDFIADPTAIKAAVAGGKLFQLFDAAESLKLDMYPREMIPGELSRSNRAEVFEQIVLPIVSRADAAASKLVWISKGSHKSRRDLRQIIRNVSPEEEQFVRRFASEVHLIDLLDEVLLESDEIME